MSFTHAIVLDFEATCDRANPPNPQEVIEFPSVAVSLGTGDVVGEFESFVRPIHHPKLTDFCHELTAIQQSDVDGADPFPEVFARHQAWLSELGIVAESALLVTCGDWDLGTMFPKQCAACVPAIVDPPVLYSQWHNLKVSFMAATGSKRRMGMAGMLRQLNLTLIGHHHRGIDDCRNLARIVQVLLERGTKFEITKRR